MLDVNEWGWTQKPENDAEFEAMMCSLDAYLASKQVLPHQRPFAARGLVGRLLEIVDPFPRSMFGFEGPADFPILKRAVDWFSNTYQGRLNPHFQARSAVIDLRGTPWRVRFPIFYGDASLFLDRNMDNSGGPRSQPSRNLLHHIEGFSSHYADRLSEAELDGIHQAFKTGFEGIDALDAMNDQPLFDQARLDYEHSVNALVSGIAYNKAKWETAQTAEKVIKGILAEAGIAYPTNSDGHKIPLLGKLINDHFGVTLPEDLLNEIDCPPKMRYAEAVATYDQALAAHRALLVVLPMLTKCYFAPNGNLNE